MTTALQIIERALLDLTVLGDGEVATAQQASDGLVYLNDLIQSWANEGLMINQVVTDDFTVSGAASYTMGSGGDIDTTRPMEILTAYFTSSGVDYPVNIVSRQEYEGITLKTNGSTYPYLIYPDFAYPLVTIYQYPVPTGGTLHISSIKPLTEMATTATVLSLPPGYERSLRLNLGVELMPQYGYENMLIMQKADESKKTIKRTNSANRPIRAGLGLPAGRGRYGNVYNGWES